MDVPRGVIREVGRLCVDIRDQAMLGLLDLATEREVQHLRQRLESVHQLALIGLAELEAMRGDERLSGGLTGSLDSGDEVEELKRGMCEKCLMATTVHLSPSQSINRPTYRPAPTLADRAAVVVPTPEPTPEPVPAPEAAGAEAVEP